MKKRINISRHWLVIEIADLPQLLVGSSFKVPARSSSLSNHLKIVMIARWSCLCEFLLGIFNTFLLSASFFSCSILSCLAASRISSWKEFGFGWGTRWGGRWIIGNTCLSFFFLSGVMNFFFFGFWSSSRSSWPAFSIKIHPCAFSYSPLPFWCASVLVFSC